MAETVGVHAQPVKDRAYVHVGPQFGAGVVRIAGLVGEDHRVVDALLPPEKVVINGHVHGVGVGLKPHFSLVAAVAGGVHGQGINGVRQTWPAGAVEIIGPPAMAPGQKVGSVVGEVGEVPVALVDGKGNDAVRQDYGSPVIRDGDVAASPGSTSGNIGERRGGMGKGQKDHHCR